MNRRSALGRLAAFLGGAVLARRLPLAAPAAAPAVPSPHDANLLAHWEFDPTYGGAPFDGPIRFGSNMNPPYMADPVGVHYQRTHIRFSDSWKDLVTDPILRME